MTSRRPSLITARLNFLGQAHVNIELNQCLYSLFSVLVPVHKSLLRNLGHIGDSKPLLADWFDYDRALPGRHVALAGLTLL